jgi:hypothetical protein
MESGNMDTRYRAPVPRDGGAMGNPIHRNSPRPAAAHLTSSIDQTLGSFQASRLLRGQRLPLGKDNNPTNLTCIA